MPPPGGCARGGGQWAGTHGPPSRSPPLTCCLRARRSADLIVRSASARSGAVRSAWAPRRALPFPDAPIIEMSALPPPSAPQFCWLPLQDLRSTAFRYLLHHGVPGPTWGTVSSCPLPAAPGAPARGGHRHNFFFKRGRVSIPIFKNPDCEPHSAQLCRSIVIYPTDLDLLSPAAVC